MRLRLESSPPLPHLKAWFSSSQLQCNPGMHSSQHKSQPAKILDLKKSICATVKPLIEGGFRAEEIILELDGFELLDDLNVEELIRDGDLVVLGLKELADEQNLETPNTQSPERLGKKRKLGNGEAFQPCVTRLSEFNAPNQPEILKLHQSEPSRKRRKQQALSNSVSSAASSEASSSSDSSSSDSDSSSSSDESDDSDSDTSDSDASSSSSSSSAPSQAPTKPKKLSQNTITNTSQKQTSTEKHVPPGQGSAQTRKRNMRRKLKRQHDAAAAARGEECAPPSHAPKGLSDANIAPLGIRPVPETTQPENPQNESVQMVVDFQQQLAQLPSQPSIDPSRDADLNISMFSLGNKNKKKGFKRQALSFPNVAGKIIFGAAEGTGNLASLTQLPESSTSAGSQEPVLPFATAPIPQMRPRLVPPSEKEALGLLPRNVFVSSVDVEEGLEKQKKKKKKHQSNTDVDEYHYVGSSSTTNKDSHGYVSCQREEEEVTLNYGDGGEESVQEAGGEKTEEEAKSRLLWTIAEQSFDALSPISKDAKLEEAVHSGVVVAWKGLALNPMTYSPEILLHLASVLSTSPTGASIRKIVRPEWEEYVEQEEDENVGWERAVEEGWRIIKS
ncbi:hypothetical protein PQX77_014614 [Marasmius sp. AFHP31]|nr:hypothetical protein PQX77_019050 [Marasmius sp. AFHP31]KAK1222500.1 hypothetical protein PQX77_014614 [Marasmius sp. AFHP31]